MSFQGSIVLAVSLVTAVGCVPAGKASCILAGETSAYSMHIVDHGWHTGIAFSTKALAGDPWDTWIPRGRYSFIEIGWGDAGYYPSEGGISLAMDALFLPGPAVLHIAFFDMHPAAFFSPASVRSFPITSRGMERFLSFVSQTMLRSPDGSPQLLGASLYGEGSFIAAKGTFSLFNNCNTWAAQAISEAGCPMSSYFITSGGLLSEVERFGEGK